MKCPLLQRPACILQCYDQHYNYSQSCFCCLLRLRILFILKIELPQFFKEIKYLKFLPEEYPDKDLMFCGDFNCPQSHTVFKPLKSLGYKPALIHQKTSLRQKCVNDDCLASEYDNIFFNNSKVSFIKSGVILFYKSFQTLKVARTVSDHVPIYFQFSLN